MCSLSSIIICRFHLDLQKRNAHPDTNTSQGLPTISIGGFLVASQRMHDAVMAEFGGSVVDENVEAEAAGDDIVTLDPDMSSGTMVDGIELEEAQPRRQCWNSGRLGRDIGESCSIEWDWLIRRNS